MPIGELGALAPRVINHRHAEGVEPPRDRLVERAHADDQYGDVFVDTNRSFEIYRAWLQLARPAPGPDNQRRPQWLLRPCRPAPQAFEFPVRGAGKEI